MATRKPRLVVLGGLVMDVRMEVSAMPAWGEAIQADSCMIIPGGKGLNQAVAASRRGADVAMVGVVGGDSFGDRLLQVLDREGISAEFVRQIEGAQSAMCSVFVNYQADAAYIGWKNDRTLVLDHSDIDVAADAIEAADALLVTLEAPLAIVEHAVSIARRHDVKVVLKPAPPLEPPQRASHMLLEKVDALIPNEWEARRLLSRGTSGGAESPQSMVTRLGHMMRPDGVACVTTGSRGCVVFARGRVHEYPGFPSNPTDTSGGSDAFCATFALAFVAGRSLDDAILEANAAGSIVVGGVGGSVSMPTSADVQRFLQARRRRNTVD